MNNKRTLTLPLAVWILTQAFNTAWAVPPPNPTASDLGGNTAGGTSTLFNNNGLNNTGFGISALGVNAFFNNNASNNAANGSYALYNNNGNYNTGTGSYALFGQDNSCHHVPGYDSGSFNTANGYMSLFMIRTGSRNTASGVKSLSNNQDGHFNAAFGDSSLLKNEGTGNTAVGLQSLYNKTTGNYNLALGFNAGYYLTSGSANVYIANAGEASESSTVRIGSPSQNRTFIAGIRGRKTGLSNAVPVVIDSNGQLGTINSSARFKTGIQDMESASRRLLELRPVTYHYKQASDDGENPLEYGLIAEEVVKVYPDLVAYDAEGKIETVQYQKLTPMLLNELQRTNHLLQADELKIQRQAQEITNLNQQLQVVAALKHQVNSLQKKANQFEALSARLTRIEAQQMVGLNQ